MRFIIVTFVLFCLIPDSFAGYQKDTLSHNLDSLQISTLSNGFLNVTDTLSDKKNIRDSLTFQFLNPDKSRPNLYFEYLIQHFLVKDKRLLHPARSIKVRKINYGSGDLIYKQPTWILVCIILFTVFLLVHAWF